MNDAYTGPTTPHNADSDNTLLKKIAALLSDAGAGGGGAITIEDGADITQGAQADAAVAAGAPGSQAAKLRRLTTDLAALMAANHTDLGAIASLLTTLAGYLDGVETGQDAGNASLVSIDGKESTQISHLSDISNALSGEVVANYLALGASDSQVIPAHSKGYGFAFFTGTGTVNGQAVVAGYAVSEEKTNNVAITIATGADSSGIIRWNT